MQRLRLLGPPQVFTDGSWHDAPNEKPFVLLAHLACHEGWLERDKLTLLLWPDSDEKRARANLRQLLRRARAYPFASDVEARPKALRWEAPSDVNAFRQALSEGAWGDAVRQYRGDLLGGLAVDDGSGVAAWLEFERESLRSDWSRACLAYAEELAQQGAHAEAAGLLEPVLRHDVLAEEVLQAYLRSAFAAGQRERALALYQVFEAQLAEELSLEPLPATAALVARLRQSRGTLATPLTASTPDLESVPSTLPAPATPFVGRDAELAELAGIFDDASCSLLTLVGPGGVGKTRLALEAASARANAFRHGCHFVPLAPLADPALLATAIAERLGVAHAGKRDPRDQLVEYVEDRQMLLVLDNLEHLLDGTGLLIELLEAAPGLRILVTSREALGFVQERLFDVRGLSSPTGDVAVEDAWEETFDAVRLFVNLARQQVPSFRVAPGDRAALMRLCRVLEGNPLGLELAAAWVRMLQPAEIAEGLEHDIDVLATQHQVLPERHRSLRAVFDQSWALLSNEEREVMAAFSVFRGGATKDAALGVTGASLRTLLMLVNKSLLSRSAAGRFEMLEPLRQFAAEKLAQRDAADDVQHRHASYFANLLPQVQQRVVGRLDEFLEAVSPDQENLRAMWDWLVRRREEEVADAAVRDIALFFWLRSPHDETIALLERAALAFRGPTPLRARILTRLGVLHLESGDLLSARSALEEADVLAEQHHDTLERTIVRINLGSLAVREGRYADARRSYQACLESFEAAGQTRGIVASLTDLGHLAHKLGDWSEARACYQRAIELGEPIAAVESVGHCYLGLGDVAYAVDGPEAAGGAYLSGKAAFETIESVKGAASARQRLAAVALATGEPDAAERAYEETRAVFERERDAEGMAVSMRGLGDVRAHVGEAAAANDAYRQAVTLLRDGGNVPLLADALGSLLVHAWKSDPSEATHARLRAVVEDPVTPAQVRRRIAAAVSGARSGAPAAGTTPVADAGTPLTLERIVDDLLDS